MSRTRQRDGQHRISRSSRHRWRTAGSLAVVAMLLGACGSDDKAETADSISTSTTIDAAAETTAATGDTGATTESVDSAADTTAASAATSETTEATEAAAPDDAVDRDADFTYATVTSYGSLDPHKSVNPVDATWLRNLYDRLVTVVPIEGGGSDIGPQLATSWETSDDGLALTFELRDDVTFQDGTPFNADAVTANMARAMAADSAVARYFAGVTSVEAIDATHVVFNLTAPDTGFIFNLALGTSGMIISPAALTTDLETTPAGSGPYTLVSAQKGGDMVLERFEGYWDIEAAAIKQLTISSIVDGAARLNGVKSGSYDAADMYTPQDVEVQALASEGYHVIDSLAATAFTVLLNGKLPPFDDVRVRQAVDMAIDRESISTGLTAGRNPPVFQTFIEGYVGYDKALDVDPYDPDAARALIKEAGAEGASVKLIQQLGPAAVFAEVIQQQLNDVGLNVEIVPVPGAEARQTWRQGEHNAFVAQIYGRPDPFTNFGVSYLFQDNLAGPSPELAQMLNDANAQKIGSDERNEGFQAANQYLQDNPVHIPFARSVYTVLAAANVVNSDILMVEDPSNVNFRYVGIAPE